VLDEIEGDVVYGDYVGGEYDYVLVVVDD